MNPRSCRSSLLAGSLCLWFTVALVAGETPPLPDLLDEALRISKEFDPETDVESCQQCFRALVERVRQALNAAREVAPGKELGPEETISILNKEILLDRKVSYISNKYWRDSLYTSALTKERGNCLATSLLYHLVAHELKLPIKLAFVPEHALVRWEDSKNRVNIETTAKGKEIPDGLIMARFELTDADLKAGDFLKSNSEAQIRAHLLANWAITLSSMERRKEAAAMIAEARKLSPSNPYLQMLEAGLLLLDGKHELALKAFEAVLDNPQGPWLKATAAFSLAQFQEARGNFDASMEILQKHFGNAPFRLKLRMLAKLGELYRHKRDFEKATEIHRLQAALDPGEHSYNDLGSVLTEAHKDKDAISAYEKALTYNPENFFTQIILAGLYERAGDREKGRSYFAKIEEPREHRQTWYCALVWYYANIGEERKLVQNMEAALNLNGSGQVYQYFLREPDLDPYRKKAAFEELMKKHAPPQAGALAVPATEPAEHVPVGR